jgi:hypothetical protein
MFGEGMKRTLRRSILIFSVIFAVFFQFSSRAYPAVPLRSILLSTNDLNDLGLTPAEGEILYDMVSGGISAHLNGQNFILPQVSKSLGEPVEKTTDSGFFTTSSNIPRTILISIASIQSPVEGELGYDVLNARVVIQRGGSWLSLGTSSGDVGNALGALENRFPPGVTFRHILPNATSVSPEDGELVADFVNNTVLFMTGGQLKNLKSSMIQAPQNLNWFVLGASK